MARFKKRSRRSFFGRKSRSRRSSSSGMNPMNVMIAGAAYGVVRDTAQNATSGITSMLPLQGYENNVAYGLLGYYLAKKNKGMLKNAGIAILTIESYDAAKKLGVM